jgi:hypothetical protein
MSLSPLVSGSRMLRDAAWLFDREQEAADNRALVEYDRRIEAENAVTFADLLEEMADFSEPRAEVFMQAYRRGTADEKHTMFVLIDQAFTRIVERRLAQGD